MGQDGGVGALGVEYQTGDKVPDRGRVPDRDGVPDRGWGSRQGMGYQTGDEVPDIG